MLEITDVDDNNPRIVGSFSAKVHYTDSSSPGFLYTVGPKSKPRINTSCPPSLASSLNRISAYHQIQHGELKDRILRERAICSYSKINEARVRKELEESKVIEELLQ